LRALYSAWVGSTPNFARLAAKAVTFEIVAVPAGPAWVWLSSKIGRRRAMVATTVSGGLFGIAAGFSQNFVQLTIFASLMSACIIGGSPIANAVITDSFEEIVRKMAKA
jgi:MFS family permease